MNFGHSCDFKEIFLFIFENQKIYVCLFFEDFGFYECGNLPSKPFF
jgi:hypothetical protein